MTKRKQRFAPEGVTLDLPPELVGPEYYTRVRNIHFRQGAERARGLSAVYGAPLFAPRWLQFARSANETPGWLYAGDAGIGFADGGAHYDLTPSDFLIPDKLNPFTGGVLNSVPVISQRRAWYWPGDTAGPLVVLPDWPANRFCEALRPYKFHLFALGVNDAGTFLADQIRWSAAAEPGQVPASWTPAPDNEAGSAELSQTSGACVDAAQLRSSFIVYKDTSTYVVDYVGGASVMAVRLLFSETGALAANCVAELPNRHIVLTDGDVITHDGQRVESIAENWVRRELFATADGANLRNAFVTSNAADSEVWVCVAEQGNAFPTRAFIYNTISGRWGIRELPEKPSHISPGQVRLVPQDNSWEADTEAWEDDPTPWNESVGRVDFYELLEASPDNVQLYAVDLSDSRDGVPVSALVEKTGISLGDLERNKTVTEVWLNVIGNLGTRLEVSVAGLETADEDPDFNGTVAEFVIGRDQKVDVGVSGRFFALRVEGDSARVVAPWRLSSFTLMYTERGAF